MNLNLNELDINDIGNWPLVAKGIMILFITLSMIALGVWFDTKKQLRVLEQYEKEEQTLKQTFEYKQQQAANLDAYQEQMKTMKASFGALLRQLPEKTEVPGLLEDISHQGLATGLEFRTIRLLPEKEIDFYVELPIEIAVIGTYHQFAEFVSNIASLPRIVTLHDFVIKRLSNEDTNERLMMNITAKTYRYTAEGESND
ncbi:type 4a pilus biogenesis protein PilO [Candidatus Berkiella cookevillensis]|uniref:Pilus assembly protein, PilO n=1 Tax=Candidatus Berkiella cookevillensis TaxID=437022 RepID=A0A0Q9YK77_9GAMM|nr:type 4a pilus biogenesis protein PilO [Candidatus Berkiella cookevillensis]MCS5709586.1 type 4a pilus biogenesis protein PilO [Candidatus Berkiella cookevillensis]